MITAEHLGRTCERIPNARTVLFSRLDGPGNSFSTNVTVNFCQLRQSTASELQGTNLTAADEAVTWIVWKSQMPTGVRIYPGSKIIHDGLTWVVTSVTAEQMDQVFKCVTTLSRAAQ